MYKSILIFHVNQNASEKCCIYEIREHVLQFREFALDQTRLHKGCVHGKVRIVHDDFSGIRFKSERGLSLGLDILKTAVQD